MMSYHVRDLNVSGVILRRQNGEGEMQHWSVELDGYTPSFEEFILEAFKVILNRTRYLGTNTVTRTRYKDNSWPSVNSSQIIVATIANDVPRISSEKYTAVEHTKRELSMYEMEALMSTTINGGFTRSSPIRWTA